MRLINGEKGNWYTLEPRHGVRTRQPLRREIEQPVLSFRGLAYDLLLIFVGERAIHHGGGNSHLCKLVHLVLHQGEQRRDHDHGFLRHHGSGQLIT